LKSIKIKEYLQKNNRIFDETYSIKYINRIRRFKNYLLVNSIICSVILILYILKIHKNLELVIFYTFISMTIFHIIGMIHGIIYWDDFKKSKNGEAIYLKNYYKNIWEKINPYGHIIFRFELLKYEWGKYIPKNTDPVVDDIRKNKQKNMIYFLPFILTIIFILIGFINS